VSLMIQIMLDRAQVLQYQQNPVAVKFEELHRD
jgi:hypothetical protein